MKLSKLAKKVLLESNSDLIPLELYSVSFQSDSHSEIIYYGADEKEALKQFNDFDDVPDKLLSSNYLKVDLSKATYSYRYIGDEEEREYFPIEEYFDDESLYELVDEGDFDVIKDRKIAARYPNKESKELLDKVNSYFFNKYGKLKYNIIPINNKDGCIQLRISDHTENLANITRYTEDRCEYFISVVISDSDPTEYKFKDINTTLKTTKDIQLKYTSDDTLNFIVNDIEKLIKKLTNDLSEMKLSKLAEETLVKNKNFLGYHASKHDMKSGFYKGDVLDTDDYSEIVRQAYMDIISDYDKNLENDDYEAMNKVFKTKKYGFTYVSTKPIEASSFQSSKYKYGDHLYKVYGDGSEIILDDYNEINAEIVVSKKPLYFEKVI